MKDPPSNLAFLTWTQGSHEGRSGPCRRVGREEEYLVTPSDFPAQCRSPGWSGDTGCVTSRIAAAHLPPAPHSALIATLSTYAHTHLHTLRHTHTCTRIHSPAPTHTQTLRHIHAYRYTQSQPTQTHSTHTDTYSHTPTHTQTRVLILFSLQLGDPVRNEPRSLALCRPSPCPFLRVLSLGEHPDSRGSGSAPTDYWRPRLPLLGPLPFGLLPLEA